MPVNRPATLKETAGKDSHAVRNNTNKIEKIQEIPRSYHKMCRSMNGKLVFKSTNNRGCQQHRSQQHIKLLSPVTKGC